MMLDLEPSLKKKKGAEYFAMDEDIDQDWIKEHQAFLVEEQRQKIRKKFDKDNEKRAAEGEKEMKVSELEERMQAAKELEKKYNKENKTSKVEVEGKGTTVEKLETNISKIEQRVDNMSVQAQDKEDNKEVALGTSKIVSTLQKTDRQGLTRTELHRPSADRGVHEALQRPDREVLLQGAPGEVRVGDQIRGCGLGVLVCRESSYISFLYCLFHTALSSGYWIQTRTLLHFIYCRLGFRFEQVVYLYRKRNEHVQQN